MRDYSKVSPQFWIGATGKALRAAGPEAQIVAMYLMTSPHANMLGLYWLPELYMAAETGLGIEGASEGLARCIEAGFCKYDSATEMVWVVEMAQYQIADRLTPTDKRCKGIQKELDALPNNPFSKEFLLRYADAYNLEKPAEVARPLEAPSEPHRSQEQEQEQEQAQEQEQKQDLALSVPASQPKRGTRIPAGWQLSDELARWAVTERPGFPVRQEAEKFRDYWTAKTGAAATKLDWDATWRVWVRNARLSGPQSAASSRHTGFADRNYHEGVNPDGSF